MDFWSKGLGRRDLVMGLGRETVQNNGKQLLLSGEVSAPVNWAYIMYLPPEDWDEFFRVALRPQCATWLLQRPHWGTLLGLMWFLVRFLPLYLLTLLRVSLGLATERIDEELVAPDLNAKGDIAADS